MVRSKRTGCCVERNSLPDRGHRERRFTSELCDYSHVNYCTSTRVREYFRNMGEHRQDHSTRFNRNLIFNVPPGVYGKVVCRYIVHAHAHATCSMCVYVCVCVCVHERLQ